MELNERINALEGELKLVKAEIKKVLVDLREMMNNYENPFVNVEQLNKVSEQKPAEEANPEIKPEEEPEPQVYPAAPTAVTTTTKEERSKDKDREELKKIEKAKAQLKAKGMDKIDVYTLTQLMKWADNWLAKIGKDKLNEIISLYDFTGRLPKENKEIISKIVDLSGVDVDATKKEKIEMKDCIIAIYQLDRIVTGETTQAPILFSEEELSKWLKV